MKVIRKKIITFFIKIRNIHFFRSLRLNQKILIYVSTILFMSVFTIGTYAFFFTFNQIINRTLKSNMSITSIVSSNIEFIMKDIQTMSSLIIIDPNIQEILIKENIVPDDYITYYNYLKLFDKIVATNDFISTIALYGNNGFMFSSASAYTNKIVSFEDLKRYPIYKKALNYRGKPIFDYYLDSPELIVNNSAPSIFICRSVLEFNHYKNVGILFLWAYESTIRDTYKNSIPSKGSIFIIDNAGKIVSHTDRSRLGKSIKEETFYPFLEGREELSKMIEINNKKMLLSFDTVPTTGWKVVTLMSTDILKKEIQSIAFLIILICLVFFVLLLFLSIYMSRRISKPINLLCKSMEKVKKGDFTQRVSYESNDEMSELATGYNAMIERIQELIDKVYILELHEREAELKSLHAQINPHFLYNTLDTIFWKAQKIKAEEIGEMVYALSKIFRLSLNQGRDLTTVSKEKELIESYLFLQKIRFKEKLEYIVNFDKEILDAQIPIFIIQPFVENAILHGIDKINENGKLEIIGKKEVNDLIFDIVDNGIGMRRRQLEYFINFKNNDSVNNPKKTVNFAIKNVYERLNLYFGKEYQLIFKSKYKKGTKVTIKIPINNNMKEAKLND